MNRVLLGAALLVATPLNLAAPASAHGFAATSDSAASTGRSSGSIGTGNPFGVRIHRGSSYRRYRERGMRSGYGFASGYDDEGDFDGNRSFDQEKWNDWWHDRPDRSFPRWVWHNLRCSEDRTWSSGAGWRCTP